MTTLDQSPVTPAQWRDLAETVGTGLADGAAERDRTGQLSLAVYDELRRTGLIAALVPVEFGGGGATHAEMGAVLRTLGRHDGATAVALAMHAHVVAAQLWRHRHGQDAAAALRRVAGGAVLVSTGASDWVRSNGRAERVDGGYRVHARKAPASGCEAGDLLVTSVRWDGAPDRPQVLHCAIPMTADGVRIDRTWDTLGVRASGSHTVVLDDVFVPDGAVSLTRPADEWPMIWNVVLPLALPLILSAYLGIADGAVAEATASSRLDETVIGVLGEMVSAHVTAADLVDAMFAEADDLGFAPSDALSSRTLARKAVAADALVGTVRLAMEAVGGQGYSRRSPLERAWRDVHGALFHPRPRAQQRTFSGRVLLGMAPAE